ncbi:hypothetical protein DFJ74DRAFT_689347 [Hyaloraphidium curvatum]|nr:hypothetical protein DFJ74DRAFT_689347 [Hyaloraphidium curvatum]
MAATATVSADLAALPPAALPAATADLDRAERDLREHGICIVKDVLSKEQVDDIRALLHRCIAQDARKPQNVRFGLDNSDLNKRVWNLPSRDQIFCDLVTHPAALRLVKSVLGWPCLLGNFSANVALPGADPGVLHADQVFVDEPWPQNPQGCNVAWIWDDYTEASGATRFVPNSHRLNRGVRPEEADVMGIPAVCPAGTMVVFESRLWHRAGLNKSDKPRAAGFAWYSKPIYRQQENWFLSLNPRVLEGASDELLTLLAYQTVGFGMVNGHSPMKTSFDEQDPGFYKAEAKM